MFTSRAPYEHASIVVESCVRETVKKKLATVAIVLRRLLALGAVSCFHEDDCLKLRRRTTQVDSERLHEPLSIYLEVGDLAVHCGVSDMAPALEVIGKNLGI